MSEAETPPPSINIRFLYRYCNEIAPMRAFYSDGIGMQEKSHRDDEEHGWLVYGSEGLQLIVMRHDTPVTALTGFATQPGDGGGPAPRSSISIETSEADYKLVLARLRAQGVAAMSPAPTWRQSSYWGWTVNDPMGETIELYFHPAEKPIAEEPVWQDG